MYSLGFMLLSAQYISKKTIWNTNLHFVEIATDNVYRLDVKTHQSPFIEVNAYMEGEYQNRFLISFEEQANTLVVRAQQQKMFVMPNDKLSAHKVLSIALEVVLPQNLQLLVQGSSTDVRVKGQYEMLRIRLGDGNCSLRSVEGIISVKSFEGDIVLREKDPVADVQVEYGKVMGRYTASKSASIQLYAVKGNIFINPKTEIY